MTYTYFFFLKNVHIYIYRYIYCNLNNLSSKHNIHNYNNGNILFWSLHHLIYFFFYSLSSVTNTQATLIYKLLLYLFFFYSLSESMKGFRFFMSFYSYIEGRDYYMEQPSLCYLSLMLLYKYITTNIVIKIKQSV